MSKKIYFIGSIFLITFLMLSPSIISNEIKTNSDNKDFSLKNFFYAKPLISIEPEHIDESVIPNSGILKIPLEISCSLTGIFAKKAERRLKNKALTIELSIDKQSDWCQASIANPNIKIPIKQIDTPWTDSFVTVTVTEEAPAYSQGVVTINAKCKQVKGMLFTGISAGETIKNIAFEIGYFSALDIEMEKNRMEITPFEQTNIPIKITNLGNGPTEVHIDVKSIPNDWKVEWPRSFMLDSSIDGNDYEQEINIIVRPTNSFSHQSLRVLITGSYMGNPDLVIDPEIINIYFHNDNTKINRVFDYALPIFFIITVIIIIFVSILVKRKNNSK